MRASVELLAASQVEDPTSFEQLSVLLLVLVMVNQSFSRIDVLKKIKQILMEEKTNFHA